MASAMDFIAHFLLRIWFVNPDIRPSDISRGGQTLTERTGQFTPLWYRERRWYITPVDVRKIAGAGDDVKAYFLNCSLYKAE
jgi:hypothetical protein